MVLGGKGISFTKEGLLNKRQLNKAQRQIVDELREKHKKEELEKQKEEFNSLRLEIKSLFSIS